MSYTFTVNSISNPLRVDFFPPIELKGESEIAFLNMEAFDAPVNITKENNIIMMEGHIKVIIPPGFYTFEALEKYLNEEMKRHPRVFTEEHKKTLNKEMFKLKYNEKNRRVEIMPCWAIECSDPQNTFCKYMGFNGNLVSHKTNISDFHVDMHRKLKVNCLGVRNSYYNSTKSSCIYEFSPDAKYNIEHYTNFPIYYSISEKSTLSDLIIEIRDQDNNLIDFHDEIVTVRVNIRKCL